jgi:hypothetical protein
VRGREKVNEPARPYAKESDLYVENQVPRALSRLFIDCCPRVDFVLALGLEGFIWMFYFYDCIIFGPTALILL